MRYRGLAGPLWLGALFAALFLLLSVRDRPAATAASDCRWSGAGQEVRWQRVHDGDTLSLVDGRRLRVIGINTPEVAGKHKSGEPFADEAMRVAADFLATSPTIRIVPGSDARDRYGRLLAHVYRPGDGASLASHLLTQGLAWQIAVPPNLSHLDCHGAAEAQARIAQRGLWSKEYRASEYATRLQPGFRVLTARIEHIDFNKSWWLETDGGFVLRIQPADQVWFDRSRVSRWRGARLQVRGWMYHRSSKRRDHKAWVLQLRHPASLRLLSSDQGQ